METIDISKWTVNKIKDWAKEEGFKIPSNVNKSKLVSYIEGQWYERQNGVIKDTKMIKIPMDSLESRYQDSNIDWLVHLHKHGWAVAPILNWDPEFINSFFDFLEDCNSNFDRNDPETWIKANLPDKIMSRGILKHYFGHNEFLWKIRELCIQIFSRIWSTQDLLSSYDGGCFLPPTKKNNFTHWIHHDTPKGVFDFCSVQGIVNFVDNGPNDGGLVLLEGSREVFKEYMEKYPSSGIIWEKANIRDPLLSDKQLIKICAPAGHIILFDSRIFHCNVPPTSDNYRMCTYVSMEPRSGATQQELNERIKMYENGSMSSHWCYGPGFYKNPKDPQYKDNNVPSTIEIAPLNDTRKGLIGY